MVKILSWSYWLQFVTRTKQSTIMFDKQLALDNDIVMSNNVHDNPEQ
jgi:hypothetical protein